MLHVQAENDWLKMLSEFRVHEAISMQVCVGENIKSSSANLTPLLENLHPAVLIMFHDKV